jgi:hypothetical protein
MDIDVSKLERSTNAGRSFDPNTFLLSQSLMKAHNQWANKGLCGIVYREYMLGNVARSSSEEIKKGLYFEYLATGALPAYGDPVPEPEVYKNNGSTPDGKRQWARGEIKPDWLHPVLQSQAFKEQCKLLGLKLIAKGVKVRRDGSSGNLDIIFQVERERWGDFISTYHVEEFFKTMTRHALDQPKWEECVWRNPDTGEFVPGCIIVDLKYSGMLYDTWGDASWNLDKLPDNEGHILQAKHYHWMSGGLPFFFWVFSSVEMDSRLIRIYFEGSVLEKHVADVTNIRKVIVNSMKQDTPDVPAFTPRPSLKQCGVCPISEGCKFRAKAPKVYGVFVS